MNPGKMLEKSIIIAAHPDDEVLWFSSILDKVDETIICFLEHKSKPSWSIGRKQSLSEYPKKNISCLGIDVSEVAFGANFHNPVITKFGIEITDKNISDKKYKENYFKLKEDLKNRLIDYRNVFTHNPWGEYGHEEHIQIYRVVKELQVQMNFNLWFSNYCSNKSFKLMLEYIAGFDSECVTLKTNKKLSNDIIDLYKKNECWTWYDDWELFNEDSFIKDKTCQKKNAKYGRIFPLNLINVEFPIESKKKSSIFHRLAVKIRNIKNHLVILFS